VLTDGVCFTPTDQVVVADALNHTVNLYTERGILLQQLLCPTDNVGTVQTCTLGPEGHLIITEYSIMGEHCMKILLKQTTHTNTDDVTNAMFRNVDMFLLIQSLMRFYLLLLVLHLYIYLNV